MEWQFTGYGRNGAALCRNFDVQGDESSGSLGGKGVSNGGETDSAGNGTGGAAAKATAPVAQVVC
ncbi:MAG TPA: hypothetical protein V6C98_08975 [Thermosynechococcaceae cyanobacterium]